MEINLNIEKGDVSYLRDFLKGKVTPVALDDAVYRIALFKTQDKRRNKVKKYNPDCEYRVGDLIFKEYAGKLPIGAKKFIEMERGVVLEVVDVKTRFGINEIKLAYEGTSDFRKYTEYLERQKIELLLPHKQAKVCEKIEFISKEIDPRAKQEPLIKKDFEKLKKKLVAALNKERGIALTSSRVLLEENLKEIPVEVFDDIKEFLKENKKSETTEFLVENFMKVQADSEDFESCCFALNYRMKMDYKIDFQQTNPEGWGKWNLISVIYYLKKDSLISEENPLLNKLTFKNRKNLSHRRKRFDDSLFNNENARYFLTQREISSGAIRLKPGIYNFGESIEIEAVEIDSKKTYILYYYGDDNLLLGFKEFFEYVKALQGMSLTFEQLKETKFQINLRTTKKGSIADKIVYNAERKTFKVMEEKVASSVFVNKSAFLESDVFTAIDERIDEFRKIETFNKLVHKIFLEFGIKEKNYEIHILRLYHILDLIYPVDLKLVEEVILSNPEFIPSEKITGVFYLDSDAVIEIEEEEKKRRRTLIEEAKKKRERVRQQKANEEMKLKEEIRLKREERRIKREDEMRMKERKKEEREREKERKRLQDMKHKKERAPKGIYDIEAPSPRQRVKEMRKRGDVAPGKEGRYVPRGKTEAGLDIPGPTPMPVKESPPQKKEQFKRGRKNIEAEKPIKTKKRVEKKGIDEKMDLEEIKKDIKLEELKDEVRDKREQERVAKKKKKKEIAYQDRGGFGGILASKLDEVVKQEDKDKEKERD